VPRQPFPTPQLLVIAGATFVCVSSEFLPTGILPDIAAGVGVTEAQAGLLISVFAFTVALTTIPLTRLTHRFPRKWLMVATLGGFAVTNVICAIAPDYWTLFAGRVLGGLAHGVFWAVTAPYAARLVKPSQVVRAASITTAGATLAFILGIPMGAAIGHAVGWRLSFVVMAGLIVLFALLVVLFLPPVEHRVTLRTGEIALPARRDPTLRIVIVICAIVALAALGQNTMSTYIVPWLIAVLVTLAGPAGGGVARGPLGAAGWPAIAAYVLWSIAFGVVPPLTQGLMMRDASARLRDFAAAALTTSFNAAIGGGALIGSFVVAGLGLAWLPWFLVGFAVLAALVLLVEMLLPRGRERVG